MELNYKSITERYLEHPKITWRLNNTILNNKWDKEKILKEILKYLGLNENKNTTYQHLWIAAKTGPSRKYMALNAYIKKEESSKMNNLCFHFRKLEKKKNKLNPK